MASSAVEERQASIQASQQMTFPEVTWNEIHSPGAYVEVKSGDLIQVPGEALGPASPLMSRVSHGAARLARLSDNPYITLVEARRFCALANINSNF
jgi:hypothetical protein